MPSHRHVLLPLLALALALGACKGPGRVAPNPAAPSALAAVQADGLTGVVTAPAGIVSQGAGNIVSQGAGNIVSQGAGNIVSQGAGNYRLQAAPAQQPVAGLKVRVLDAAGKPVNGLETTTDAAGRYSFPHGVPARGVRVVVEVGGHGQLEAIAPKGRTSPQADIDLASTLSSVYIVARYVATQADPLATLDRLTPDAARATVGKATSALAGAGVQLPTTLDGPHVAAAVERLRQQDAAFDRQLEDVRKLLVVGASSVAATDGPALQAVVTPQGLAVDARGVVYFTDKNVVRKLTPDGRVATIAGSGEYGDADGKGTAAAFSNPGPLVVDGQGNLVLIDFSNGKLRKVTPEGTVSTLVPAGAFDLMSGLAIDGAGTIYVAESRPPRIQKVTPDGKVALVADGFTQPGALVADGAGKLYLLDGADRIQVVAPDGIKSTIKLSQPIESATAVALDGAGGLYVNGPDQVYRVGLDGQVASFAKGPAGGVLGSLAADAHGTVYLGDPFTNVIARVGTDGRLQPVAGTGLQAANGTGTNALFADIWAVAWGPQALYVFDDRAHRVSKVGADGSATAIPGSDLDGVVDITVTPDGQLYLADVNKHAVRRLTPDGKLVDVAGGFAGPGAIATDAKGLLYVHDNGKVVTVSADGTVKPLGTSGVVATPADVHLAVAPDGTVFISDGAAKVVRKLAPGATAATPLSTTFEYPQGIAVDARGNAYVTDVGARKLYKLAPDGTATTLALPMPADAPLGVPVAVNATTLTICSDKQVFNLPLP
jgi:sugar lactone lactonase YvrE